VPEMTLWHFDCPKLYRAVVTGPADTTEVTFGARSFTTEGPRFVLNGEYVRLCGVEWMPGSNPAYGNAELSAQIYDELGNKEQAKENYREFYKLRPKAYRNIPEEYLQEIAPKEYKEVTKAKAEAREKYEKEWRKQKADKDSK
ncbi:MAG: hypothetical protein IIU24_03830, partial [Selenomonas sp.]|nr:hypothetical protein [Selenomonas sp.]